MSRRGSRRSILPVAWAIAACAALTASACGQTSHSTRTDVEEITVAAASDLRPAFEELGAHFEADTGTKVTFSFGSSGQLREQILNGAPFDLFASANVEFVDEVIADGRGVESTKADYAFGRIVMWAPDGATLPASIGELADDTYRRIVIANPEHAPYGLAARQALEAGGVYEQVESRLIYGENVSDAFRIATSGNADVAIVAQSLAIADGGNYTLIPAELHDPLEQALVVTSTGARGEAAAAFARLIASDAGREVMNRYGFALPGESQGTAG